VFSGPPDIRAYTLHYKNFSYLDNAIVLYNTLVRSKLEYASVVRNILTLTDSNKTENIRRQFANLCWCRFLQFNILCVYSIFNCLHFKTLYSRHLDALFLINIFKGKMSCHFNMDTFYSCAHKASKRIFCFSVSSDSPSARCAIAENDMQVFGHFYQKQSPVRILSGEEKMFRLNTRI
jgi:hypothetical protein